MRALLPVLPVLILGCNQPDHPFPRDFLWGSATAGFQVDMGCPTWSAEQCDDTASDWYQWVTDPGMHGGRRHPVPDSGEPALARPPGMWETWPSRTSLRWASTGLHNNAVQASRWSGRGCSPTGAAERATTVDELVQYADPDAVARYHQIFAGARRRAGLTPMVTLNHYTLPLWLHDGVPPATPTSSSPARTGGWLDGGAASSRAIAAVQPASAAGAVRRPGRPAGPRSTSPWRWCSRATSSRAPDRTNPRRASHWTPELA